MHGHPAFVFHMLYVTTAFRHALQGETVNDAIFLDSNKKLAHAHFPTHERRWGWYVCLYDSTGIIANYICVGVDPSPAVLQHVKKISGTSGKIISLK